MSAKLRVQYDRWQTVAEMLDFLVDNNPIELRDVATNLLRDVETLKAVVAELEAHPAMVQAAFVLPHVAQQWDPESTS